MVRVMEVNRVCFIYELSRLLIGTIMRRLCKVQAGKPTFTLSAKSRHRSAREREICAGMHITLADLSLDLKRIKVVFVKLICGNSLLVETHGKRSLHAPPRYVMGKGKGVQGLPYHPAFCTLDSPSPFQSLRNRKSQEKTVGDMTRNAKHDLNGKKR